MAKSTEIAKTNPNLLAEFGGVDKNDVLAIVVSRAETQLNGLLKDETDAVKLAESTAAGLQKTIKADSEREARESVADRVATLETAVKAFGTTKKVRVSVNVNFGNQHHNSNNSTALSVSVGGDGYNGCTLLEETIPFPTSRVEQVTQYEQALRDVSTHKTRAVELRRQIGNIGTLERQFRARMAEEHLRGVEGGEAMLAKLTAGLQDAVLALPGV